MSSLRKFASKKNSKGVIGDSSDRDLHTQRMAEVRTYEWPHNPFMDGEGIRQEFAQFAANVSLTDFIATVAEEEPQEWDAQVPAPQHFNMGPHGYYEW